MADRLEQAGFTDSKTIMDPAHQWETHHAVDPSLEINATRTGESRGRAPNWSRHETARLCHVIADVRHLKTVTRIYQRVETREELDQGRQDPFVHEFLELFNSTDFTPSVPESVDSITEDVLVTFEPPLHLHIRNGTTLKQIWATLRSSYTIASSNYNASGQSDPSTFPSFTSGDDSLCYMHCVFQRRPSLDAVIRALSETAQIEAGIGDMRIADSLVLPSNERPQENGFEMKVYLQLLEQSQKWLRAAHLPNPLSSRMGVLQLRVIQK